MNSNLTISLSLQTRRVLRRVQLEQSLSSSSAAVVDGGAHPANPTNPFLPSATASSPGSGGGSRAVIKKCWSGDDAAGDN